MQMFPLQPRMFEMVCVSKLCKNLMLWPVKPPDFHRTEIPAGLVNNVQATWNIRA